MAEEKKYMPMSTAGIINYNEELKEGIKLDMRFIIIAIVAIVTLELALPFLLV